MARTLEDLRKERETRKTQTRSLDALAFEKNSSAIIADIKTKLKEYDDEVRKYGDIYNGTFFDESGKAKSGYISDIKEKGKAASAQTVNIVKKRRAVEDIVNKWSQYLDKDYQANLKKYLDNSNADLTKLSKDFQSTYDAFGSFESESDYNGYLDYKKGVEEKNSQEKEYIANYDAEASKKELDKLASLYDHYTKTTKKSDWGKTNRELMQYGFTSVEKLERAYKAKEEEYGLYTALAEKHETKKPSALQVTFGDKEADKGLENAKTTYVPGTSASVVQGMQREKGEENLSRLQSAVKLQDTEQRMPSASEYDKTAYEGNNGVNYNYLDYHYYESNPQAKFVTFATDEEYKLYSQLLQKGDTAAAEAYAESLDEELNTRMRYYLNETIYQEPGQKYFLAFGAGVEGAFENAGTYFDSVVNTIKGNELEANIPIEQQVFSDVAASSKGLQKVALEAINTTSAMLPAVGLGLIPGVGSGLAQGMLFSQAAGGAVAEAKAKGYTDDQAMQYGTMVGATELLMEKFLGGLPGVSKLSKAAEKTLSQLDNVFLRVVGKAGLSGFSEVFEEGIQAYLEPYIATIVSGEDYDPPTLLEALYQGLLGFLSGVGLSTVTAVPTEVARTTNVRNAGRDIKNTPELYEGLVELGANIPEARKAAERAQKKNSDYNVGMLYGAIEESVRAESKKGTSGLAEFKNRVLNAVAPSSTVSARASEIINNEITRELDKTDMTEEAKQAVASGFNLPSDIDAESDAATEYVKEYVFDVLTAYEAGYIQQRDGSRLKEGQLEEVTSVATPEQLEYFMTLGKESVLSKKVQAPPTAAQTTKNNANIPEGVKRTNLAKRLAPSNDELIKSTKADTTLNKTQQRAAEIGEKLGLAVIFDDTTKYYTSKRDGASFKSRNVLLIDKNAVNPVKQVFVHELTHFSEKSEHYAALSKKVLSSKALDKWLTDKETVGADFEGRKLNYLSDIKSRYAENNVKLTDEGVNAEMVAEFLADTVGTEERFDSFMSELTSEEKKTFLDWLKETITRIYDAFSGSIPSELREIERLYKKALKDVKQTEFAEQNTEFAEQFYVQEKQTSTQNKKIDQYMTDSERAAILKNKVIFAPFYEGQVDESIAINQDKLKSFKDKKAKEIVGEIAEKLGLFKSEIDFDDVDVKVMLSKSNLKESASKDATPTQIAKLLPILLQTAKSAVHIERHNNRYYYDTDTVYFDNLLGAYIDGDNLVPIRFGLKHSRNQTTTLYVVVDQNTIKRDDLTEIKKDTDHKASASDSTEVRELLSRATYSISEIVRFVNSRDILRYIPNEMLNDLQRDAKWKAIADTIKKTNNENDSKYAKYIAKGDLRSAKQMVKAAAKANGYTRLFYHGAKKGGGFTKFRDWSYFTENKAYAERYADRNTPSSLYTVYGKLENAFDTRKPNDKKLFKSIKNEYGLSDIQDSGLPDWTDGYDISDYIDENDLPYDGIVLDEGGDLVDGKPISRGESYVIRKSAQIKSADTITYDDDGNIIPLSKRFNTEEEDIRFSIPENGTDSTVERDDRTALATALEGVVTSAAEREIIVNYKNNIAVLNKYEADLKKLKAERKKLSFAKGPRNTARLAELDNEIKTLSGRITRLDRKLVNLEVASPIKSLIEREKGKAKKSTAKKYQEARKENVDKRESTKLKVKIAKKFNELNKWLLNPTKNQHVPENLRPAVAMVLDAINLGQIERYEAEIQRIENNLATEEDYEKLYYAFGKQHLKKQKAASLRHALLEMKEAYASIQNSKDPEVKATYDEYVMEKLSALFDSESENSLKDVPLHELTRNQLEQVYDVIKAMHKVVTDANKLFADNIKKTRAETGRMVVSQLMSSKKSFAVKGINKLIRHMLKPATFFENIGSTMLNLLYKNIEAGESKKALLDQTAKDYALKIGEKYGAKKWDTDSRKEFVSANNTKFSLSMGEMMSIYAYSNRAQAMQHLTVGGFELSKDAIKNYNNALLKDRDAKTAISLMFNPNDVNVLTPEMVKEIADKLTEEQKQFVDEMVKYLSEDMAKLGNEVTMKRYNIKGFREGYYFPIVSSPNFIDYSPQKTADPSLLNMGFTKELNPKANNPIVLYDFMALWGKHIDNMTTYYCYALPVADFQAAYNNEYTKKALESWSGSGGEANEYIQQLLKDINHASRGDPTANLWAKGLSQFKYASTGLNLSVVIQQPSSLPRAMAYIDSKYFVTKSKVTKKGFEGMYKRMMKHSGVAILKEMGGYDTELGRGTADYITGKRTPQQRLKDVVGALPSWADSLAWRWIWNAAENKVLAETNLEYNTARYWERVAEVFENCIRHSQVYDSTLSRSQLMRSRDGGSKLISSFMAEPTTVVNMAYEASMKAAKNDFKSASKIMSSVAASVVLNSALVSIVKAMRDDDEDESFAEKYLEAFVSDLLDGANPITYLPLAKDIWSLVLGYSVERSDLTVISKLVAATNSFARKEEKTLEDHLEFWAQVANLFFPAYNVYRDGKSIANTINTLQTSGFAATKTGTAIAMRNAIRSNIPVFVRPTDDTTKADALYDSYMSGDAKYHNRLKKTYSTEEAYRKAMVNGLRNNDWRVADAAIADVTGDVTSRVNIAMDIIADGFYAQEEVVDVIFTEANSIRSKLKEVLEYEKEGDTKNYNKCIADLNEKYGDIGSLLKFVELDEDEEEVDNADTYYKSNDLNVTLEIADYTTYSEVKKGLVQYYIDKGQTKKEALSSLKKSVTTYWKPKYLEAWIAQDSAEMKRITEALEASGLYDSVRYTKEEWYKEYLKEQRKSK